MSDHCPECGIDTVEYDALSRAADKAIPQFWHIGPEQDGLAGPFASIEEAQADALQYLHTSRYHVPEIVIVQTVAVSHTEVSYKTTWRDDIPHNAG